METQPVLEFKLDNKGLWDIRMRYLVWMVATYIIIAGLMLFAPAGTVKINNVKQPQNVAIWVNQAFLLFPFLIGVIVQQLMTRSNNKGLTIRLNDEMIELTVPRRVSKLFYFAEVTNVIGTAQGSIHLYAKGQTITIPKQINRYCELAAILRSKFPSLGTGTFTFYHKYCFEFLLISLILFMSLMMVDNKILLSINGMVLMGLLLFDLRKRYLAFKSTKLESMRKVIICELIIIATTLCVLILKLIK